MEIVSTKHDEKFPSLYHIEIETDLTIDGAQRYALMETLVRTGCEFTAFVSTKGNRELHELTSSTVPDDWLIYALATESFKDFNGAKAWFSFYRGQKKIGLIIDDMEICDMSEEEILEYVLGMHYGAQYILGRKDEWEEVRRDFKDRTGIEIGEAVDILAPKSNNKLN